MSEEAYNFSYSKLATYLDCPKKYELQVLKNLSPYKETIYTAFGSAIHKAIQLTIEKKYSFDESLIIFEKELREHIKLMNPRDAQLIFISEWTKKAKDLLKYFFDEFYTKIQSGEIEVLAVEKYFKYEIKPGIFYNGIIDLLIKHNCIIEDKVKIPFIKTLKNGRQRKSFQEITNKKVITLYKILDWKTGAVKPKENLQLLSYTLPIFHLEHILINNIEYIYLKHKKKIGENIDIIKVNDTKNKIISIINNILTDIKVNSFKMCLDENKCKYCDVKKFCDLEFKDLLNKQEK